MSGLAGQTGKATGRYRHGGAAGGKTPEYRAWRGARSRCNNPNDARYADWGGKGVRVCARWDLFENFLADMGPRPAGASLDRHPNRAGNYEPGNCRWATPTEQSRNRDYVINIEHAGKTISATEAAKLAGVDVSTIRWRLRNGRAWNQERYAR